MVFINNLITMNPISSGRTLNPEPYTILIAVRKKRHFPATLHFNAPTFIADAPNARRRV